MPALSISIRSDKRANAALLYRQLRASGLSRPDCVHLLIVRYGWAEYRATARSFLPERLATHLQAA